MVWSSSLCEITLKGSLRASQLQVKLQIKTMVLVSLSLLMWAGSLRPQCCRLGNNSKLLKVKVIIPVRRLTRAPCIVSREDTELTSKEIWPFLEIKLIKLIAKIQILVYLVAQASACHQMYLLFNRCMSTTCDTNSRTIQKSSRYILSNKNSWSFLKPARLLREQIRAFAKQSLGDQFMNIDKILTNPSGKLILSRSQLASRHKRRLFFTFSTKTRARSKTKHRSLSWEIEPLFHSTLITGPVRVIMRQLQCLMVKRS